MHLIIGFLTALGGLIWALHSLQRAGFDLDSLNPFHWYRRHQWKKKYGSNPLYSLDTPMEAAAVLMVGLAKCEGEISREQKAEILGLFEQKFHLDKEQSRQLFISSAYLLKDTLSLSAQVAGILERSKKKFTQEQANSLISMLETIAGLEGDISGEQKQVMGQVQKEFDWQSSQSKTW